MNHQQTYNDIQQQNSTPIDINLINSKATTNPKFIIFTLVFAAITFILGFVSSQISINNFNINNLFSNFKQESSQSSKDTVTSLSGIRSTVDMNLPKEQLIKFNQVLEILKTKYVEKDIDFNKLGEGAIKGMVESLEDNPTAYFTKTETDNYQKSLSGGYEGIGAELKYSDGFILVKKVFDGSPAQKAGVKAGTYIAKVEDYDLKRNDSISDVVSKIRGPKGTTVNISFADDLNGNGIMKYTIVRDTLTVKSMEINDMKDGVVYIKISRFTEDTLSKFKTEWDNTVTKAKSMNPKKIIVDLRGNGGGYLDGAYYIASDFLKNGQEILHVAGRNGIEKTYSNDRVGRLLDIPVYILVNSSSASASEILAGALQQGIKAKVIGEKTYGKGTAQQVIAPNEWQGASLHFTVQKWLLPDKRNITKKEPIIPDYIIEEKVEDIRKGTDKVLEKVLSL